ncbi:acyl-CoA transferase/carnitine dehydratase [Paramagnetospirillum caucaseum]|uniref:Acyl-CoA transferase/carnitine dehydratase n=1 Tax=Paramagnetospirillum caucaseum TaxID=1244869 RepID=M2ZSI3_9PROT|nr:CoA transferase [Paramagnetospirillum caucaseum]EME70307.1 acyl-CoA transferase/carnitine dehydratase [Paramagnetospirillum caucaseum]
MIADCLAGLKVLDLSMYIPGPLATLWLSDLGAEVVKVESPAGDPMRTMGPVDDDGTTAFYKLANANKTIVTLDLKSADGKARFAEMVAGADVLLEGFRPGVMERLGFGIARLHQINPRLVHCALSGYGGTGPFATRAGHDVTYLAVTGLLAASGPAERPIMTFPPLADHAGAMLAVNAILAALLKRSTSGKGTTIDISLAEAALSWMGGVLTMAQRWGDPRREHDLINGGAAFYRIYRTKDGRFAAIAALEEKFWQAFCTSIGKPDWIARQGEPLPQHDLIAEMETLFASRTLAEWTALLEPADCTFEPVLEPHEVATHPHHVERGFTHVSGQGLVEVLLPVLMEGERPRRRKPLAEASAETVVAGWS